MDKLYVVISRVVSSEGLKILVCGDKIIVEVILLLMLLQRNFSKFMNYWSIVVFISFFICTYECICFVNQTKSRSIYPFKLFGFFIFWI